MRATPRKRHGATVHVGGSPWHLLGGLTLLTAAACGGSAPHPTQGSHAEAPGRPLLLFRVAGRGVEPSYLLGTCPSASRLEDVLPPDHAAAFARATTLLLETNTAGFDPLGEQARGANGIVDVDANTTLRESLGDDEFTRLTRRVAVTPALLLEDFTPWAAQVVHHQSSRTQSEPVQPTESWLRGAALREGVSVEFLETLQDQYDVARQPSSVALPELRRMLAQGETFSDGLADALDNCRRADLGVLDAWVARRTDGFTERFLFQRNDRWMPTLGAALEHGNAFIAVGAGHLAGARGLLERMRESGYSVTQLESTAEPNALPRDTPPSHEGEGRASPEGATRAEWFSTMAQLATERFCADGSALRTCFYVDHDECEDLVERSGNACTDQLAEVVPAWIDEAQSRRAWETFGTCVAGGYTAHLRVRDLWRDTPECTGGADTSDRPGS